MLPRHWFFFVSHVVLILFLGILLIVVVIAFSRRSGSTGLDMATIQKLRYEALMCPQTSSISQ